MFAQWGWPGRRQWQSHEDGGRWESGGINCSCIIKEAANDDALNSFLAGFVEGWAVIGTVQA